MQPIKITSTKNPKVKNCLELQKKASERREQNLCSIEGLREISLAKASGFELHTLFYCPELIDRSVFPTLSLSDFLEVYEVSLPVFEAIAYREHRDGVLVLARPHRLGLDDLTLADHPLIVIAETVEKPGNLGALLRTCDAAAVDAVICCDSQTDLYNPNVIRSSIGCLFTNQVVSCSSQEAIDWLKKRGVKIVAAALSATEFYHEANLSQACALVMGSEAWGLSDKFLSQADLVIKIPMQGKIDSMNVSTSAGILIYEAKRQRGFK